VTPGDHERIEGVLRRAPTVVSAPGEHPWRVFADRSGNELCVLAPRT
jgi:hypothetical protein